MGGHLSSTNQNLTEAIEDNFGGTNPFDIENYKDPRFYFDPGNILGWKESSRSKAARRETRRVSELTASVTRDQWQHFLDFYRPIEQKALAQAMQTDFTAEGNVAGATAAASVNASKGTAARNLSRAGTSLTGEERSALGRRQGITLSKAVSRAENVTRRGLKDSRAQLLAGIVGAGRGVSTTAMAGLQSVADLAAQRQLGNDARSAAADSSRLQSGTTIAGYIIGSY